MSGAAPTSTPKNSRRNADDREWRAGKRNRPADNCGIAGETPGPVTMTDHGHGMAVRNAVVVDGDGSTGNRIDAKQGKVIAGNEIPLHCRLNAAVDADAEALERVTGQVRGQRVFAHRPILLVGESGLKRAVFRPADKQKTLGIGNGQHSPHDGVNKAKDGGIRTDSQRERQNDNGREYPVLSQAAKRVTHIQQRAFQIEHGPEIATVFPDSFQSAEREYRLAPRFLFGHSGLDVVAYLLPDMELQLRVQLPLKPASIEESAPPVHTSPSALLMMSSIAFRKCAQFRASASSSLRPLAVSR